MQDPVDDLVEAYLVRLGLFDRPRPTLASLHLLVARHLCTIPFENVDVWERRPIVLTTRNAVEKIVIRRRGGFCFELNEAFRALLAALGFQVRRIDARVWLDAAQDFGAAFDHLALVATFPEGEFLVDVGFGDNNRLPMRLPDDALTDVSGSYRLRPLPGAAALLLERLPTGKVEGEARPLYRMTLDAQPLAAFEPMCAYHQSSRDSIFTKGLICTLPTDSGRVTVTLDRLIVVDAAGRRETPLADAGHRASVLESHFKVALQVMPANLSAG
jgi:N-hydroxyarylamine O-acetyltransferase